MSEIDPRADVPLVDWSDLGVSGLLPTGTVTLLLADVENSTGLWETQPEQMTAAFARLHQALSDLLAAHGGVRPVEQGEGDSFVAAFARASDAVACALGLQRAPLAPIRLRIGGTPVRCSCVTRATTSVPPSTAPRASGIWPTVARRCSPARRRIWSPMYFRLTPG
jgi:class 3 adenylate cyclase